MLVFFTGTTPYWSIEKARHLTGFTFKGSIFSLLRLRACFRKVCVPIPGKDPAVNILHLQHATHYIPSHTYSTTTPWYVPAHVALPRLSSRGRVLPPT